MWGRLTKVTGDLDLTAAPQTSAPTQGTAPTNSTTVLDGWNKLTAVGGLVPDELYLLVYVDDDDADVTPWFYCPDFNAAGDPAVGKHVPGAKITAVLTVTADAGRIFRIPIPPMATHVRLESSTSSTTAVGALYSAEEVQ